ncbi:MAG: hypothetical protein IJZ26_00585 [Clostridia bacterium]|nr:hypothetical protein [Clostridia bacterium]
MKIDKSEKQFWNKKKFKKVDEILKEEFKDVPKGIGFCHKIWARKKQLLKEMYGINWQSPADLNPRIIFD